MKKLSFLAFLVILSCLLFKKEEEVMPLAVDNFWVYQYQEEEEIDTLKLIGKQTIEGVDGYVCFSTYEEDTLGIFYYRNDYLWFYSSSEEISQRLFPQRPKIGNKWLSFEEKRRAEDFDGDGKEDSINYVYEDSIIAKEALSVPVGNFEGCYQVEEKEIYKRWYSTNGQWQVEDAEVIAYSWVKMGIGVIKRVDILEEVTQELIAYTIK